MAGTYNRKRAMIPMEIEPVDEQLRSEDQWLFHAGKLRFNRPSADVFTESINETCVAESDGAGDPETDPHSEELNQYLSEKQQEFADECEKKIEYCLKHPKKPEEVNMNPKAHTDMMILLTKILKQLKSKTITPKSIQVARVILSCINPMSEYGAASEEERWAKVQDSIKRTREQLEISALHRDKLNDKVPTGDKSGKHIEYVIGNQTGDSVMQEKYNQLYMYVAQLDRKFANLSRKETEEILQKIKMISNSSFDFLDYSDLLGVVMLDMHCLEKLLNVFKEIVEACLPRKDRLDTAEIGSLIKQSLNAEEGPKTGEQVFKASSEAHDRFNTLLQSVPMCVRLPHLKSDMARWDALQDAIKKTRELMEITALHRVNDKVPTEVDSEEYIEHVMGDSVMQEKYNQLFMYVAQLDRIFGNSSRKETEEILQKIKMISNSSFDFLDYTNLLNVAMLHMDDLEKLINVFKEVVEACLPSKDRLDTAEIGSLIKQSLNAEEGPKSGEQVFKAFSGTYGGFNTMLQ